MGFCLEAEQSMEMNYDDLHYNDNGFILVRFCLTLALKLVQTVLYFLN